MGKFTSIVHAGRGTFGSSFPTRSHVENFLATAKFDSVLALLRLTIR